MAEGRYPLCVKLLDKSDVGLVLSSLIFWKPDCHKTIHFLREKIQQMGNAVFEL